MKKLWKDIWSFYDAVYSCAFKKDVHEIRFENQNYEITAKQKMTLKEIMIGYWFLIGVATYLLLKIGEIMIEYSLLLTAIIVLFIYTVILFGYLILAKRYVHKKFISGY